MNEDQVIDLAASHLNAVKRIKRLESENKNLSDLLHKALKVIDADLKDLSIAKMDTGVKRCLGFFDRTDVILFTNSIFKKRGK